MYDIEKISAAVHEQWMESKRKAGVTSRKSESGVFGDHQRGVYKTINFASRTRHAKAVRRQRSELRSSPEARPAIVGSY